MSEPTDLWKKPDPAGTTTSSSELSGGAKTEAVHPSDSQPLDITLVSDSTQPRLGIAAPVVFPGYEILGELGRGGMGVVYRARQRNLNRQVALKVIRSGPLASEEDKARFHVEAEAAARLHHANIVQVCDVGVHGGISFVGVGLRDGQTVGAGRG